MTTIRAKKPTSAAARTKAALSKKANVKAQSRGETLPKSFRLPADLVEALEAFVYSEKNVNHQSQTKVVEAAIRQYIGADKPNE